MSLSGPERIRISVAQINPRTGDLTGNTRLILKAIEEAREQGCHLVVTPELGLTGYCLDEKLLLNHVFLRQNKDLLLRAIAPASQGIAAVVGFIDFDPQRLGQDGQWTRYNAAAVLRDGRLLGIVHKRLLPSYRYFDDKRYFQAGGDFSVFPIPTPSGAVPVGILICEDLWDDEYPLKPARISVEAGARLLVAINASPYVASSPGRQDGKRFHRRRILDQKARSLGVPMVYVNTVGAGDNGKNLLVFDGMSQVVDRDGKLVLALPAFREGQASVELTGGRGEACQEPPFEREEEIFEALSMGLRDYCDKIGGFQEVLEPVSGGIDSALGTAIAYQAVGRERLRLYNLPSRFSSQRTRDLAARLASNFGLSYRVIPIEDLVRQARQLFESHLHPLGNPITAENMQARLRGLLMMMEANDRGALLVSNGNSTEIALGYATLYGDMAGGLSLIGDLIKPDIYRLARYVNRRWGREMIPQGTLDIPPSAELSAGQVDPFDYELVGPMVRDFVEEGLSPGQLSELFQARKLDPAWYPEDVYQRCGSEAFAPLARDLFARVNRMVYKRLQGAPIIAVTERAFGFDLRETLINAWREEQAEEILQAQLAQAAQS